VATTKEVVLLVSRPKSRWNGRQTGDIGFSSSLAASRGTAPEGQGLQQAGFSVIGGASGGVGIAIRKGEESLKTKVNAALKSHHRQRHLQVHQRQMLHYSRRIS
jgi:hypothetical protein